MSRSRSNEPLPPPLPPETRTVGQLIAETLKLYGRNVPLALAIGLAPAALDLAATGLTRLQALVLVPLVGGPILTLAFIAASVAATDATPSRRALLTAFLVGIVIFVPFPFLASVFILPGLVWLAFIGLSVPAAVTEGIGFRASFSRGLQLGRADFVHALGGLAALAIIVFMTRAMLFILLQGFGESTARAASFLADLVVSPLLFLGAGLLYVDQAARVGSTPRTRRS
ncbi:MAG: hypothetical protein M3R12_05040 [Actinomycetota bacterium]|nr:hypothetical protein [Actinomycetota bacterium]